MQEFFFKNELIETMILHHSLLENALLESNQQSSAKVESASTLAEGISLEKKRLSFAFYNKEIDKLLTVDKDLSIKTDPWWLRIEDLIFKKDGNDKEIFLISDKTQIEKGVDLEDTKSSKDDNPTNKKFPKCYSPKEEDSGKGFIKKTSISFLQAISPKTFVRNGIDDFALNKLELSKESNESKGIDAAMRAITHLPGSKYERTNPNTSEFMPYKGAIRDFLYKNTDCNVEQMDKHGLFLAFGEIDQKLCDEVDRKGGGIKNLKPGDSITILCCKPEEVLETDRIVSEILGQEPTVKNKGQMVSP